LQNNSCFVAEETLLQIIMRSEVKITEYSSLFFGFLLF